MSPDSVLQEVAEGLRVFNNPPTPLQLYWQRGQNYSDVTQTGDGNTVLFSPTLAHAPTEPGSVTYPSLSIVGRRHHSVDAFDAFNAFSE
jgi:hypothetical protein